MAVKPTSSKNRLPLWKTLCVLWCVIAVGFWISFFWMVLGEKTYEFLQPRESITEIRIGICTGEVFLYNHADEEWPDLVSSAYRVHTELDPGQFDSFLGDFHQLKCHQWFNDPNPCIREETLQIRYDDGSVEWICAHGTFSWDSQTGTAEMTWYYFDADAFREFLCGYCNLP